MKRILFTIMTIIVSITVITIFLIVNSTSGYRAEETCKLVQVIFRHGDRTPTETYKNDPYKDYNWPNGWGSLTKKGKRQLFELGTTLHERYKFFFDENVSTNIIHARSSDSDRCHMSGAAFLAGLFPPTKNQIWNPYLNWQPIPIHSLPRNLDNIVAMKKPCRTYEHALEEAYKSKEIQNINEQNKDLYELLTKETGQDMKDITAVEFLFNTLEIEDNNGLKLPDWTKDIYPERMKRIAIRSLEIFTETDFMKRMKGGVLLKDMIENMKNKKNNNLKPDRNFFIYSAHDISLINFMRPLGLAHNLKPEYGAAFIMEAHATDTNDYEVRMLYYNTSSTYVPVELKMEICGDPCYLNKFIEINQDMIPEDWEKECQN